MSEYDYTDSNDIDDDSEPECFIESSFEEEDFDLYVTSEGVSNCAPEELSSNNDDYIGEQWPCDSTEEQPCYSGGQASSSGRLIEYEEEVQLVYPETVVVAEQQPCISDEQSSSSGRLVESVVEVQLAYPEIAAIVDLQRPCESSEQQPCYSGGLVSSSDRLTEDADEVQLAYSDSGDSNGGHQPCHSSAQASSCDRPVEGADEIEEAKEERRPAVKLYNFYKKKDGSSVCSIGGKRKIGQTRSGLTQCGQAYGVGTIVDNVFQPRDISLEAIDILPEDYGWRKYPRREVTDGHNFKTFEPSSTTVPPWTDYLEMFHQMFDRALLVWIKGTNQKGEELAAHDRKVRRYRRGRAPKWKTLTLSSALAFISILLWMDVDKKPELRQYWSVNANRGSHFVRTVSARTGMSKARYQQVLRATRLYDKDLAACTGKTDRTSPHFDTQAKIRPFIDALNLSFQEFRVPGTNVAIDESMSKYKGVWSNLQTMPSKPIKRGIKHFYLCDSVDGFVYRMLVHTNQVLPYSDNFGYSFAICWGLLSGQIGEGLINYLDSDRVLFTDRWYTSVPLYYALAKRRTFAVGTVLHTMKNLPEMMEVVDGESVNLLAKSRFPRGASISRHDTENVLSFNAWSDSKNVLVLSSHPKFVDNEFSVCRRRAKATDTADGAIEIPRPLIAQLFSEQMGGVDICDQLLAVHRRHTKTYCWYTSVFIRGVRLVAGNIYSAKKAAGGNVSMLLVKERLATLLADEAASLMDGKHRSAHTLTRNEIEEKKRQQFNNHEPKVLRGKQRRRCFYCKQTNAEILCLDCDLFCHDHCWVGLHKK